MTDEEMLEAAARAAGFKKTGCSEDGRFLVSTNSNRNPKFANWRVWNPRDDDGDSRRLQVKLKLEITWEFDRIEVFGDGDAPLATEYIYDNPPTDECAATRLAVLRAAAVIGGYREATPG